MTDPDIMDIVTMLRAPDRLEPHLCAAAADEIERLRAERDEARRSVCDMCVELGGVFRRVGGKIVEVTTAEECAEIMRWDCFDITPNDIESHEVRGGVDGPEGED